MSNREDDSMHGSSGKGWVIAGWLLFVAINPPSLGRAEPLNTNARAEGSGKPDALRNAWPLCERVPCRDWGAHARALVEAHVSDSCWQDTRQLKLSILEIDNRARFLRVSYRQKLLSLNVRLQAIYYVRCQAALGLGPLSEQLSQGLDLSRAVLMLWQRHQTAPQQFPGNTWPRLLPSVQMAALMAVEMAPFDDRVLAVYRLVAVRSGRQASTQTGQPADAQPSPQLSKNSPASAPDPGTVHSDASAQSATLDARLEKWLSNPPIHPRYGQRPPRKIKPLGLKPTRPRTSADSSTSKALSADRWFDRAMGEARK